MKRSLRQLFCLIIAVAVIGMPESFGSPIVKNAASKTATLSFIENKGQITDQYHKPRTDIQFKLGATGGLNIFIGGGAIHYQFSKNDHPERTPSIDEIKKEHAQPQPTSFTMDRMDVELVGADKNAKVVAGERQDYYENYFTAGTGENAATVHAYNRITYIDIYPNIDWVLYTRDGQLKHEFVVRAGGKISDIKLKYGGAKELKLNNDGSLTATTPQGAITEQAPDTYQKDGKKVSSGFVLDGKILTYKTGDYNGVIIIDPTLEWGTYYGAANEDLGFSVAEDPAGNVFMSGRTYSLTNIATVGAFQSTSGGGAKQAYLVKFDGAGVRQWATYYGGGGFEQSGEAISVDGQGNIYMCGYTASTGSIATPGAYMSTFSVGSLEMAYVVKFNNSGSRIWGTYFGGTGGTGISGEGAVSIALDQAGYFYITGTTSSPGGLASAGAYQTTFSGVNDAFLAKFDTSGGFQWATYFGSAGDDGGNAVAVDGSGDVIMTGHSNSASGIASVGAHQTVYGGGTNDGFLAKFNSSGTFQWATYLGGSLTDNCNGLGADAANNIYVLGSTASTGLATAGAYHTSLGGAYDAFLSKFNGGGTIQWGTYIGAVGDDAGDAVVLDDTGNVYVCGWTRNTTGIATAGAYQTTFAGGFCDAFFAKFVPSGALSWASYFGGNNTEECNSIAWNNTGVIYLAGRTYGTTGSTTAMVTTGAHQAIHGGDYDAYLAKFDFSGCSLSGISTVGPTGTYPTIAAAIAAINATGLVGPLTLELETTYTGETYPITIGPLPCASATNTLTIRPQGTLSITGTGAPMFDLNGAQYVIIDGRIGSSGSTKSLTINNTSTTGQVIRFINDASNNVIKHCTIMGATAAAAEGVIIFGTTAGTTGNDNNTIDSCDILDGSATYTTGIYSSGTTTAGRENSGNVISNCNIANFFSAIRASAGIDLTTGNTGWTISNNRFYQTVPRSYVTVRNHAIRIDNTSGNNFTVSGNIIGFASSTGTGTYTITGGGGGEFHAILLNVGTTIPSSIQGNTITNISYTNTSGSVALGGMVCGINITDGSVNVGNITPNVVGAGTGTGAITGTSSGDGAIVGISVSSPAPAVVVVNNNIIGSITANGTTTSASVGIQGIQLTSNATKTISGNTIGSTTTANSINSATASTTGDQFVFGINASVSGTCTITADTIANLSGASVSSTSMVGGLYIIGGGGAISGNRVFNISGANINGAVSIPTSVFGIVSNRPGGNTITHNVVNTISNTNSTSIYKMIVGGIEIEGAPNSTVTYNRIYDLRNASTFSSTVIPPEANGILIGTLGIDADISNNMISLGNGQTTNTCFAGIMNNATSTATLKVSHNSVSIEGTVASGGLPSAAFIRGDWNSATNNPVDIKNNIFMNNRTGGTGKHYAIVNGQGVSGVSAGWGARASNYNILNTANPAVVGYWEGDKTLAGWRSISSCDSASDTATPVIFSNTATGDLHINMGTSVNNIESNGTPISGITDDYDGDARPGPVGSVNGGAIAPDLGADEFDGVPFLPITGPSVVCAGATITLSNATSGGTWSSGNVSIATVGSVSGIVTGVSGGIVVISYTTTAGSKTKTVTVDPLPATPAAITGPSSLCVGATIALSDATPGGTWSSTVPAVASVGSTGIITGLTAGIATISYTFSNACGSVAATKTVTVNATSGSITGVSNICAGATATLTGLPGGGIWSSSNIGVASVGSSTGLVSGVAAGTATITYTHSGGCIAIQLMTVNASPGAITGAGSICAGANTMLSATGGGTWTSGTTSVATVGSSTGIVSGVAPGTSLIAYTLSTGCAVTTTITVNVNPAAITPPGPVSFCAGATQALANATIGGVWSSSATGIATVGTSGVVFGIATGTATISYTLATGCFAIKPVTVNTSPVAMVPLSAAICAGSTTTFTNAVGGGTWSSSASGTASVVGGVVTGVSAGTATISYTIGACFATAPVTVNAAPAVITPVVVPGICAGATTTLANATLGGTWSSGSIGVATVGSSGLVTGVSAGTATISYTTAAGCSATRNVTVNASPAGVSPSSASVCTGNTVTLSDAVGGGVWTSSASGVASVSGGVVTGVTIGTATITYTIGACFSTATVTVNLSPGAGTITGPSSLCVGSPVTFTDATPGGIWSSSNTAIATVSPTGLVTGVTAGTAIISYSVTNSCGTAVATATVAIDAADAGTVIGLTMMCAGTSTTLVDAIPGGVWSASNGNATISSTGILTAITPGIDTIYYTVTNACGSASARHIVTIGLFLTAGTISGPNDVCAGSSITLTDPAPGGTWSASNTNASVSSGGVVTGVSGGTVTISYTVVASCGSASSTHLVTVTPIPDAGVISGPWILCAGMTDIYTTTGSGGVWSVTNPTASITSGGVVTTVAPGSDTIMYTVVNMCGTSIARTGLIIGPAISAGSISGPSNVCTGATITLTDPAPGGVWSASNTNATVSAGGLVTGITAGTVTISYTVTSSCGSVSATAMVTVDPLPAAGSITGPADVCVGATITLTNATPGGVWSASNANATVSSGGVVTGVTTGTVDISYTVTTACGTASAISTVTVSNTPVAGSISGPGIVCESASITLTATAPGGTWSASNTNATVSSGGVVTGITAGTVSISYTVTNSCGSATATMLITINPLPDAGAITGPTVVCVASTILLTDLAPGGTWSASNTNATVSGGLVMGVTAGAVTISYTVTNSCGTATAISITTVNPLPDAGAIIGGTNVCIGTTLTLTDAAPGGTWSASNGNATVVGGIVTGITAGMDTISYTVSNSCGIAVASVVVTIGSVPTVAAITGPSIVCRGASISLADATTGGTWTASNAKATVSTTGLVTGVTAGLDTIRYTVTNACGAASAMKIITISQAPSAGMITGASSVCVGLTITLSDAAPGGTWSSSSPMMASVSGSGIVSGLAPGSATISYTVSNSCGSRSATHAVSVLSHTDCNVLVNGPGNPHTSELKVYPNPNQGSFNMNLLSDNDEPVTVVITNIIGVKIKEFTTTTNKANDIRLNTAPGIYLLTAITTNGRYITKVTVE